MSGSFRTVSKRPPIQEINNRLYTQNANNTTQVSIALQQSYIAERQTISPAKNYHQTSRSRSLATLGDITNLKYNTPNKESCLKVPQVNGQTHSQEIIGLANRINELARNTIQYDKDQQLESMIEKEKMKKIISLREHEIEELHRRYRCLQEEFERTIHQKEDTIQDLLHEARGLEQRLVQAEGFMKRMNDEHNEELNRLQSELQEKGLLIEQYMKQISLLNEELYDKSKQEQMQHQEIEAYQDENHQLRRTVGEINSSLEDITLKFKDVQIQRSELERVNQSMHFDLEEQIHRCGSLEDDLHMLNQRQEETSQELSTWINKFQHLDRGHQIHIEEMRKQYEFETQRRIDQENQKYHQKIQQDIGQFELRIRQEQQRSNEQEQNIRSLEQERDQLIEENHCKEIDNEDMKNEISNLSKIELDNRKMVAHIQYLENKLEGVVQDGLRSRQYGEEYRNKVSQKERNLAEQVNKLQQERDQLDNLMSKSNKEIVNLQSESQGIITELHSTQSELQKTRVHNEELQTNIKLLSEDVRNLQVYRQRCHEQQQNFEKREDHRFNQLQDSHNLLKLEHGNLQQALHRPLEEKSSQKINIQEYSRSQQSSLSREIDQKTRYYADENNLSRQR